MTIEEKAKALQYLKIPYTRRGKELEIEGEVPDKEILMKAYDDAISQPKLPTDEERLQALEQAMLEMIMGGM